jgi:hypothetical protein
MLLGLFTSRSLLLSAEHNGYKGWIDLPIVSIDGLSHSRVEAAGGPALKSPAPALSRRCERIRLTRPVRVGQLSGQPCSLA